MASRNPDSQAVAGPGTGALADPTTGPATPSGNVDAPVETTPGQNSSDIRPVSTEKDGEDRRDTGEPNSDNRDPVMDDQSQVLSRIKKLQDELVNVERKARLGQIAESIESRWDRDFERMGVAAEQRHWALTQNVRTQSLVKDTTAFAFGREWAQDSEDSFIWQMLERDQLNRQLIERRTQWEAKKGITQAKPDDSAEQKLLQIPFQRPFQYPALLDPMSPEMKFHYTAEAQGYDTQERELRSRIHDIVRQKHHAFLMWNRRAPQRVPDPKIDAWPRPVVSYVQWKIFKFCSPLPAFHSEEKKNLFAVDVLDGEPDSSVSRESYDRLMRTMRSDGSEIPTGIPEMAHGLVPERIRLNGLQFAQTFRELGFDAIDDSQQQIVLLQPYRLLIHLEQRIRDRHASLKAKLEASGGSDEAKSTSEQGPYERIDVDTEISQKDEAGTDSGHEAHNATRNEVVEDPQQKSEDESSGQSQDTRFPLAHTKIALAYLGCLINVMDTTVFNRRDHVQGPDCRKVHFRDLWYLFSPGDEVVRRDEKQVYKVIEVVNPEHRASSKNILFSFDDEDTSRYFRISCVFVDFDGKRIGPVSANFVIKAFAGEKSVEALEVYPLRLHRHTDHDEKSIHSTPPDSQTLRQNLIRKGKTFFQAACMKLENTFYSGQTADGDEVESQVVVDFETALSSDHSPFDKSLVKLDSLLAEVDDNESIATDFYGANGCLGPCCDFGYICDDSFVDEERKEQYIDSLIPKNTYAKLPSVAIYPRALEDTTGDNTLTDDEFLLMSYRVFAFILRTRKWAELDLTYMEDATKDDSQSQETENLPQPAFEQLVLPDGHKNIVLSLISQHYRNKDSGRRSNDQSDIVRGKGKGLILLLHGAPGVGKTSTAEGIAEKFKKPLFTITCGDLGSTAKEVEQALDLNFTLANRWGCILLLDEADVFLSSRTETDFERNGLVAVFLRVLEYYAGILFLTTNRVGVIDEAFRSRIHISLYYPPLGYDETRAVFKLNLKLIQGRFNNDSRNIKIDQDEIIDFALDYYRNNEKARWNGRQIRNACQTALALAEFKAQGGNHEQVLDPDADVRLAVENFQTVSKAYLEFTKYLKQLYGIHEDVRAKELGLRATDPNRQARAQSSQPGSFYSQTQPYNSTPQSHIQAGHGHSYQSNPMVGVAHMNPSLGVQQPSQQVAYYSSPAQVSPATASMAYGAPSHPVPSQVPQQGQEYMGMQFQPAQGNTNQPAQPWQAQTSPPNSAIWSQPPPAPVQQYQNPSQQGPGTIPTFGSPTPLSQSFQAQQTTPAQQNLQQQAPQTWYPNMNVQNMQPGAGQNPTGPQPSEGGQ